MDIPSAVWFTVDDSNITAAPDGSPEGMMPSGVNNVLRAHQGAVKRWYTRTVPITTGGTGTAYSMAYSVAPGALYAGESFTVLFHVANAALATLNISALGAKPLHYYSAGAWRAVPAALWGANQILKVNYDGASAAYRLLDLPDRTGEIVAFAGATAPAGSLLCYGQAISRTAYAGLFAALSTAHGVGDGTSTFNLPDLRGLVVAGKGNMGGTDSGDLSGSTTLGAGLGAQTHTHGYSGTTSNNNAGTFGAAPGAGSTSISVHQHTYTGTTVSGSTIQPTRVLNYVIRI